MASEFSAEERDQAWAVGKASFPDRKLQRVAPFFWREAGPFDWTDCPEVEVVTGRLSGVPVLVGTRFSADNLLALHEGGMSADEIADEYDLDRVQVARVLQFARKRQDIQAA
jgi:uncharacterized protein (DUF433 family)